MRHTLTWVGKALPLAGGTMTGDIAMGDNKVTGLGEPTAQDDALRKARAEIINADINGAADIVRTKLDFGDGLVHGDVATANKDGTTATPSLRTLGTGAQQAAAGDHTHTVATTEAFGHTRAQAVGVEQAWVDFSDLTGTIPANAKRVETYGASNTDSGSGNGDIRVLYNDVEKATVSSQETLAYGAWWEGAGIGSEAILKWQAKLDAGSGTVNCNGAGWYQTLA